MAGGECRLGTDSMYMATDVSHVQWSNRVEPYYLLIYMATYSQRTYRVNQTNSMSYTEIQADFSRKFSLTEDELTAALRYDHLSFEDAQVAAAGDLASVDAILTNDAGFIKSHERACRPQDLIPALEEHLGEKCICRVIQVTEQGTFRVEISNPAGGWRQTLPLTGFPTQ